MTKQKVSILVKKLELLYRDEILRKLVIALMNIYSKYREERLRGVKYWNMDAVKLELTFTLRKLGFNNEKTEMIVEYKESHIGALLDMVLALEKGGEFLKQLDEKIRVREEKEALLKKVFREGDK